MDSFYSLPHITDGNGCGGGAEVVQLSSDGFNGNMDNDGNDSKSTTVPYRNNIRDVDIGHNQRQIATHQQLIIFSNYNRNVNDDSALDHIDISDDRHNHHPCGLDTRECTAKNTTDDDYLIASINFDQCIHTNSLTSPASKPDADVVDLVPTLQNDIIIGDNSERWRRRRHHYCKVETIAPTGKTIGPIANGSDSITTTATIYRRKTFIWQFLVTVIYTILYISTTGPTSCLAARQEASNCTFPQRWEGSWFLSGNVQPVSIKGSRLSFRGTCVASDGDKFLIVDDKGCHRCLVIYEKHKNVLQYKESECEGDNMFMMDQANPAALPIPQMHSSSSGNIKSDHRGVAHPNTNGHSRLSSSDPYSMRSNDDSNYYCKGRENLQTLCEQIAGDALLYSLFKENAEPVKCPIKGPFTFTYNRGHGECKNPVSNIESCTEDSRLLLSFQACPDVSGTESTVEELTCLAAWKDGNSRYLVGLVSHHHATSNEERYRCFVYEKIMSSSRGDGKEEFKLAQSGDATCNGLDSAEVGSRIMTLRRAPPAERCDFPSWFKGPRHWHALMGNSGYNFHPSDGSMHINKPSGFMETRALCEQINKQTSTEMMAVVHYTTGCQSGFMCMMFYRRDTHVAEIQMGTPVNRLEDACAPDYFDVNKMPYITLLASNPESPACPSEGLYSLRGAIGPPYITSRHKRNHSNKGHGTHRLHSHHDITSTGQHRRHTSLTFRNSEDFDHGTWHMQTRGLPLRSRRDTKTQIDLSDEKRAQLIENSPLMLQKRLAIRSKIDDKLSVEIIPIDSEMKNDSSTNQQNDGQRNRRDVPGCVVNYNSQRQLLIGCTQPNVIGVRPQCNEEGDEAYTCHGSWTENATVFIIARHLGSQHGVCISYRPLEGNSVRLVVGDACYRGNMAPPSHHLSANLTVHGKCSDTNSSPSVTLSNQWIIYILSTIMFVLFVDNR